MGKKSTSRAKDASSASSETQSLPKTPSYPEHNKLKAVKEKSQTLGSFIDWLRDPDAHGETGAIELMYYPYITEQPVYGASFRQVGYEPIPREEWERSNEPHSLMMSIETLLAQFFEIDLKKLEEEKRQMLDEIRKQTGQNVTDDQGDQG